MCNVSAGIGTQHYDKCRAEEKGEADAILALKEFLVHEEFAFTSHHHAGLMPKTSL